MNSILLCLILLLGARTARADEPANIEASVQSYVQEQVSKECETCKVKIFFPDRLPSSEISGPALKVTEIKNVQVSNLKGETTVYFEAHGKQMSGRAEIRWMDQVVIADNNISHGTLITESDLKLIEKDITFNNIPYVKDVQKAKGKMAKRNFTRGQFIDENFLKKPHIVKYGQPLKLILDNGSLSMSVSAKARGSGAEGDLIPILITRTGKKVMAQIVDQTTARME